jgi:hypothetical protein
MASWEMRGDEARQKVAVVIGSGGSCSVWTNPSLLAAAVVCFCR